MSRNRKPLYYNQNSKFVKQSGNKTKSNSITQNSIFFNTKHEKMMKNKRKSEWQNVKIDVKFLIQMKNELHSKNPTVL